MHLKRIVLLSVLVILIHSSLWVGTASGLTNKQRAANLSAIISLLLDSEGDALIPAHNGLRYSGYPANCLGCHMEEAQEMFPSTHFRWQGPALDMANGVGQMQGKISNAVNSYCIHILGNWPVCGSCHAGRGKRPDDPGAGLGDVDCLVCHNTEYAAARTRLNDGSMGVTNPTDTMVLKVAPPGRANCLKCHANAGGGDGVKRGDLSQALVHNSDDEFDVHMNTNGPDLSCQDCHRFENHRVIGKGSDLRPTDDPARGAELSCTGCHTEMADSGHAQSDINRHVARVACQSCHIPIYAKVATESHRDWLTHHDGTDATVCTNENPCPGHPHTEKASDQEPVYEWWNRRSDNALLGDNAQRTYDAARGTYPTSRPLGHVQDGKLYPFKYKTALQPKTVGDNRLIAIDTFVYLKGSGNVNQAVESGLSKMGYSPTEPYEWVTTDTLQLINHGVEPSAKALTCNACHESTNRMDLQGRLGYELKDAEASVCSQCHEYEDPDPEKDNYQWIHSEHVEEEGYDCLWCHNFTRPERGLRTERQ